MKIIIKKLLVLCFMIGIGFNGSALIGADEITTDNYGIIDDYLYNFNLDTNTVSGIFTNTTVEMFRFNLNDGIEADVYESASSNVFISDDSLITEGMMIEIRNEDRETIGFFTVIDMRNIDLEDSGIVSRSSNKTPHYFYTITIGKAIDVDGKYGAQCFDLFNYFTSYYYNGVRISGAGAKDIWLNRYSNGVLNFFDPVSLDQIKDGDWVIWGASVGGGYGHVGMFRNSNGSNFGIFLNQNYNYQQYTTQDSISYNGIIGVLRPKIFSVDDPKPVVIPKQSTPGATSGIEHTIFYRSHVSRAGWLNVVGSGQTSGTTGYSAGLEAFYLDTRKLPGIVVNVQTHAIKDRTWKSYNNILHNTLIGSTGQSNALNAFKISSNNYAGMKIQYRAHISFLGWTDWQEQNTIIGSENGARIEAIQIRVVDDHSASIRLPYRAHTQSIGWGAFVNSSSVAGVTGKSLRLEGLQIDTSGVPGLEITATTQSQGENWRTVAVSSKDTVIGVVGQSKEMYAISLKSNISGYKLYYSAHISYEGWSSWVEDGTVLGSSNSGKRIEAIKLKYIKVVE